MAALTLAGAARGAGLQRPQAPLRCIRVPARCAAAPGGSSSSSSSSGVGGPIVARAAPPPSLGSKAALVARLLAAKDASGKSYSQLGKELGLTNVYTAQLFHHQQQLQPGTAKALAAAVPGLTDEDIHAMMAAPMRSFDPEVLQEPAVYRLYEAITHAAPSIKAIVNEEFGDGIMSAINFFCSVDKAIGPDGQPRVVLTFNGKFLPYVEQRVADIAAQTRPEE